MLLNEYFETISFAQGAQFNVSHAIDTDYMNKLHWHPFVEILVSLAEGNAVSVNFCRYELGINDILLLYPGDLHSIEGGSTNAYLIIQFPNELFTVMNELRDQAGLFSRHPYIRYDRTSCEADGLLVLLKKFAAEYETQAPFREVRMYALLLQFFERVGRRCLEEQQADPAGETGPEQKQVKRMAEACLYISQNCTKPLTLEDVAAQMGVSKSYFANLFKRYTNTTFVAFLTEERIKRAQRMFRKPNVHIIDIAFDSGFMSLSAFNRAFKKITSMSPSKFRETMTRDMV